MFSTILFIAIMVWLVVIQRIFELRLARRNRIWALQAGAQEFGTNHYPLFFLLHTGWMAGWVLEAFLRGPHLDRYWFGWLVLFVAAQGLRYWAIASLGRYWNTRILVIPGRQMIRRGPYRYLAHPNYMAVVLELASVPMIFGAWITALIVSLLNAVLLLGIRIPAEKAALQLLNKDSKGF